MQTQWKRVTNPFQFGSKNRKKKKEKWKTKLKLKNWILSNAFSMEWTKNIARITIFCLLFSCWHKCCVSRTCDSIPNEVNDVNAPEYSGIVCGCVRARTTTSTYIWIWTNIWHAFRFVDKHDSRQFDSYTYQNRCINKFKFCFVVFFPDIDIARSMKLIFSIFMINFFTWLNVR